MKITDEMVARGYEQRESVANFAPNDLRRMMEAALNTCAKCGRIESKHVNGYCQDAKFEALP